MKIEELGIEVSEGVSQVLYGYWISRKYWYEYTYDNFDRKLTDKCSNNLWYKFIRDEFGIVEGLKKIN
jgi:hypothetical protein